MIRVILLTLTLATAFGQRDNTIQKAHTLSGKITGLDRTHPIEIRILKQGSGPAATVPLSQSLTWQWTGAVNGSYIVQPYHGWFTFTPATRTVPVNGAGVGNLDFHATNHHHAK